MKELKYFGLLSSVVAMALCGCNDDLVGQGGHDTGRISLDVDVNATAKAGQGSRAFADDGVVTPQDLAIKLTSADGSFSQTWASVEEFGQDAEFTVGEYTLEAYFGNADDKGFECPYVYGSAPVKVRVGETTQVGLTATLSNSMFTVVYSEAMQQYLQSYSAELMSQGAAEPVAYAADETRPAYMPAGKTDVYVSVTKPTGTSARLLAATVDAKPRHHYIVSVDIKGGAGAETLTVTFDDALETEDYVIELSDELMNAPAPTIEAQGFDPAAPVEMMAGTAYDGSLAFAVMARGQIKQVKLATSEPAMMGAQWPAELELVGMSEADQAKYTEMGLSVRGLWRNPDKMALVDLAGLLKNATLPAGVDEATLQFTLTAFDRLGKASEPATLTVALEKEAVILEPIEGEKLKYGYTTHKMQLGYNGGDPVANVELQYKNERGTWTSMPIMMARDLGSRSAMRNYEITFAVDAESSYVLRAATKNGSCYSSEQGIEVQRVMSETFEVAAVNVFATNAYLTVLEAEGDNAGMSYANLAQVYVSTDNTAWTLAEGAATEDGAYYHITGLQPASTYYIKATLTGEEADARAAAQTCATEAATQLDNSGMEDWYVKDQMSNWKYYVPGANAETAIWSTMNGKTTSEGHKKTWFIESGNIDYNTSSGTIPTTTSVSGNAALIRTVAWGVGTTDAGAASIIKNIEIGQLYLGHFDESSMSPVYGYAFASRPASLSFAARYEAKDGSDYGRAVVKVLAADGSVIAENTIDIDTSHNAYETFTLPLAYNVASAKAASLQVCFYSSAHPNGNKREFLNLGVNPKRGGQLFVDDITLNY